MQEEKPKTTGTILVVDDQEVNVILLQTLLVSEGYNVLTASDGMEALEIIEGSEVDLVLLDVLMPGIDGIEVCRRIRKVEYADYLPVIIVTALADRESRINGKQAGCDDFITKPIDRTELLIRVQNLLLIRLYHRDLRNRNRMLKEAVDKKTAELRGTLELLQRAEKKTRLSRDETINRLARAAEFRDDDTALHVQRMSHYCALLARQAGVDRARCDMLRMASTLHDVGKIGIPDQILLKPGKLTREEFEVIKTHCDIGLRILDGSEWELLTTAATITWTHHEKFDGSGYPRGLSGEAIPQEGRISAVADVFDALTSKRVHKPAFSVEKSIAIMKEGRGTHFDPGLLDVFLNSLDEVLRLKDEFVDGSYLVRGRNYSLKADIADS